MKVLSLSLLPSFFGLQLFLFFSLQFAKKSLTSLSTVVFVSSFVFSHGSFFGLGSFFAGRFHFFFGGCTNLKDCARDLCGSAADGC
jgi:hypothetical protein